MRKIILTELERITFQEGAKNHKKAHVRNRFQALLWNNEGVPNKEIANLLKTRTRTLYTWINRWEEMGLLGLFILPGRGLQPTLSTQNKTLVETVKKKQNYLVEV